MSSYALSHPWFSRRYPRAFFSAASTRHVKSRSVWRELGRAVVALGGLMAWAAVLLLVVE